MVRGVEWIYMNENKKSPNEDPAEAVARNIYHELDRIETQIQEQLQGNVSAENLSVALVNEVSDFLELARGELYSKEEYQRLLQKLDTAIAINNEPYARELRARLIERYAK